eukprot:CAMPEP_0170642352 /NCGR_PEP_ID=MMETSP0224-20130122/41276_1 /TAXON_ID=285029 /ORGANISM="Togula jolla, Strain CCCM 725" /LENGTH=113 /DNA_ID=CAMNT_0010973047 /DNA_START=347 /DNA_END=685 /DNA_ORIENTATION=-
MKVAHTSSTSGPPSQAMLGKAAGISGPGLHGIPRGSPPAPIGNDARPGCIMPGGGITCGTKPGATTPGGTAALGAMPGGSCGGKIGGGSTSSLAENPSFTASLATTLGHDAEA